MTRTDYLTVTLAAVVLLSAVAGIATAVSYQNEDVPQEGEVGNPTEATVTIGNLYEDHSQWTLVASTELTDVRWNVTYYNQTGAVVDHKEVEGTQNFQGVGISSDRGISTVTINVEGSVPPVEGNYSYPDNDTFTVLNLAQNPEGGTPQSLRSWETVQYTSESREARQALNSARTAIQEAESAGVDATEAKSTLNSAINVYKGGNFQEAKNLANKAESQANDARNRSQSQSQQFQLILLGVGALVVLAVVVGGVYYYRQSQQDQTRLR